MDNKRYEEIIKSGEKVDWYGIEVPKDLITNLVTVWSSSLKIEIDKLESTLSDLKGTQLDRRKSYIDGLIHNLQNAPYSLNGDVYLKRKKSVEQQIEKETKNKETKKKKIKKGLKTTKTNKVSYTTKNSNLIFGKNKK